VFREWVPMAILAGQLPAKARAALTEGASEWLPRGWPWVDPLKDVQAAQLSIGNGLESRKRVLADAGEEFEDVFEELAAEKKLAEEKGIIIEQATQTPRTPPADATEATGGLDAGGAETPIEGDGTGNGKAKTKPRAAVLAALRDGGRG
jgi:capsid protein